MNLFIYCHFEMFIITQINRRFKAKSVLTKSVLVEHVPHWHVPKALCDGPESQHTGRKARASHVSRLLSGPQWTRHVQRKGRGRAERKWNREEMGWGCAAAASGTWDSEHSQADSKQAQMRPHFEALWAIKWMVHKGSGFCEHSLKTHRIST